MDYKAVRNLATLFFDQSEAYSDRPFLWAKHSGTYQSQSYAEVGAEVSGSQKAFGHSG